MSQTPDSRVSQAENVQVVWTEEHDNPAYGAVSIRHRTTEYSTSVIRMSANAAAKMRDQITELLGERL